MWKWRWRQQRRRDISTVTTSHSHRDDEAQWKFLSSLVKSDLCHIRRIGQLFSCVNMSVCLSFWQQWLILDSSLVMLCEAKCLLTLFVFLKCRLRLQLSFSLLVNLLSHFENWNKVMVYFFPPKGEEHVPLTSLYALLRWISQKKISKFQTLTFFTNNVKLALA